MSLLNAAIAELDDRICHDPRVDPALFLRLTATERELGILHGDRPICPFLRPHFFSRTQYERVASAAEILARAFEKVSDAAFENSDILNVLALTEAEERLARLEPRYPRLCVSSRLDSFLDGDDFKFLEYNAETPAGIGDQMQLDKVLDSIPPVREFLDTHRHWRPQPEIHLLEALIAAYKSAGGTKRAPNIAIVDWKGVDTSPEFTILKDYFESQGFASKIADPEELEYDGTHLRAGDFVIDIFYKRVIIHEFLERYDDSHPLVRAYADGNVVMANSFRVKAVHKKASFAIASDERYEHIFSAAELETIRRHIPWTRRVADVKTTYRGHDVELLEFVRHEREGFLLKPNDDYGGHGIKFGWESTETEWEEALDAALRAPFIVQERAPVGKVSFPTFTDRIDINSLNIDFDPFLFNGKVHGGLVRLSSQSLVNITAGGGETSLVVLEDF